MRLSGLIADIDVAPDLRHSRGLKLKEFVLAIVQALSRHDESLGNPALLTFFGILLAGIRFVAARRAKPTYQSSCGLPAER